MYKVNDAVFYGVHGVCIVEGVSKRDFCGTVSDYYTLQPVYNSRSKVFVSVERAENCAVMRKILTKDEVLEIIDSLNADTNIWIDDDAERKIKFNEVLKNGTRNEVAFLIKTVYEQKAKLISENKKIHAADERFLEEAEKAPHEEFAYVLSIPKENVQKFICERLDLE